MKKPRHGLFDHVPDRIYDALEKRLEDMRMRCPDLSGEFGDIMILKAFLCTDFMIKERDQEKLVDSYRDHLQDLQSLKSHNESLTVLIDHKIGKVKQKGV